jgi:hypothetical protein
MRQADPAAEVEEPARVVIDGDDDATLWFTATVRGSRGNFVGVRPVPGGMVAVCHYDYADELDAEAARDFGMEVLRSMDASRVRGLVEQAAARPAGPPALDRLLPLLISETYAVPPSRYEAQMPHGVRVVLVEDLGGACAYLTDEHLDPLGSDPHSLLVRAVQNLEARAQASEIQLQGTELPGGVRIIVSIDHWLSATCLLLPGLYAMVAPILGAEWIRVRIPHREGLVIYPDTQEAEDAVVRYVLPHEVGRKPITEEVFRIGPEGLA